MESFLQFINPSKIVVNSPRKTFTCIPALYYHVYQLPRDCRKQSCTSLQQWQCVSGVLCLSRSLPIIKRAYKAIELGLFRVDFSRKENKRDMDLIISFLPNNYSTGTTFLGLRLHKSYVWRTDMRRVLNWWRWWWIFGGSEWCWGTWLIIWESEIMGNIPSSAKLPTSYYTLMRYARSMGVPIP